ncbi:MAG: helix-turn-helix transcriptional regulator [Lachnospiraceae bacterium]|nr:helix-turn-helix transcriptional regulator [Lachnospiraceae bacterium]
MKEKKELNVRIGNRVHIARRHAGLTQEQFGDLVSLAPKHVSDIERGLVGISVSTLKRICEKLSVSSEWLLFGEQNFNECEELIEKLNGLSQEQLSVLEGSLNQIFRMFSIFEKSTGEGKEKTK